LSDLNKEKLDLLRLLEEKERRIHYNKITTYYPDEGPLRRELYQKHLEIFAAGKTDHVRCAMGANRTGKSEGIGCYEMALHLTGRYPEWWDGLRFDRPIFGLSLAKEPKLLRRAIQRKLFGGRDFGSGLIPKDCLDKSQIRNWPNGGGAYEYAPVKHVSGGWSELFFGTYEQGREAFESMEVDFAHEDEEAPLAIHEEVVMRTMTTNGQVLLTYTPIKGMTDLTTKIWNEKDSENPSVRMVNITWNDVPHLTQEQIDRMYAGMVPWLRDARARGIPASGVGRIYPVDEKDFVVKPFPIPDHFRRVFAIDCGWHMTAVIWGAYDKDNDVVYLYTEHYKGEAEVPIHASAIKARGIWIPGVGDVAGKSQMTGEKFQELYKKEGVPIRLPNKEVEAGLMNVLTRLTTGRLKVFSTCENWLKEFRNYSYDEKQNVIKVNDHLMDATRYLITSGLDLAKIKRPESSGPAHEELTFGLFS
jgi:phage terminase large subunit-like protein